MEQLGYTLIDIANGSLPWERETDHNSRWKAKYQLAVGGIRVPLLHKIYVEFLEYTMELEYNDDPDYDKWVRKFQLIDEEG